MKRHLAPCLLAPCLLAALAVAGCPSPPPEGPTDAVNTATSPRDLGPRPSLGEPIPYRAPEPEVFQTAEGTEVWLVRRPGLPVVSLTVSVPVGAADDPVGKAGLAHITRAMLDEGAGERGALEISSDIQTLGASLGGYVDLDGSRLSLSVLKKHLPAAFEIFADVVARPRFEPTEWSRVKQLWIGNLEKRADSPEAVAAVLRRSVLYGPDTPYGHPTTGYVADAKSIELAAVETFYREQWRPDRAKLVVAGDITREELEALLRASLGDWKKPAAPPASAMLAPAPLSSRPRLVIVDQPDAPQAVLSVVGKGVASNDEALPLLELVNTALGGSFTSRLNQNLREDHGWTYGARSRFSETRGVGPFVAYSSVELPVTGAALREMLSEIEKMAKEGLSPEELAKTRARDLTDTIQTHETVGSLAGRLTSLAILGLEADYDAEASARRQQAELEKVNALAREHLDPSQLSLIVVGPKNVVLPQLKVLGLGEPEIWSAEGRPVD